MASWQKSFKIVNAFRMGIATISYWYMSSVRSHSIMLNAFQMVKLRVPNSLHVSLLACHKLVQVLHKCLASIMNK